MNKPLIHLEDKVAIITGASRGIGEAIAVAFAQAGAKVVLASRKLEGLQAVADQINAAGGQAIAVAAHTGKTSELERLFAQALEKFGKVDVLVNNAATNPYFGPMMGIDDGAIAKTFEVNMKGYLDAARMTAGHLMDRNAKGSIVSIASVAGLGAAPMQGIYGMTKASVISMTQTLAYELGSAGIRVNAIAPGLIKTKFAGALVDDEDTKNRILGRTPLGRIGEPQDIAGAALFLASDAAAYVTGHVLVADGGLTLATI